MSIPQSHVVLKVDFIILFSLFSNKQNPVKNSDNMNNSHPLANSKKAPNPTPPMPDLPGSNLNLSQVPSAPSTLQSQVCDLCQMFANLDNQINDTASSWLDEDLPDQLENLLTQTMQANVEVVQFFKCFNLENIQAIAHAGDKPHINDVISPFPKHLFENPNFIAFLKQLLCVARS